MTSELLSSEQFQKQFHELTGNPPFPWQQALYERFTGTLDQLPEVCRIPTGLGKTSVLTIWWLARQVNTQLPRRLVYVVNRRTVVDQTTAEAERLQAKVAQDKLAISTLRGQFADNHKWSQDPSRPAIVVGTVDMIGSRLLFSGYGVGYKVRPLHAGFLGQDTLLIHDEAHLEPAFQKLIESIKAEQTRCKEFAQFHVLQLTATTRDQPHLQSDSSDPVVTLQKDDLDHPVVEQRIKAAKQLKLTEVADDKNTADKLAELAERYKDEKVAVLVFVRTLEQVSKVETELKKTKRGVILLTGTMRGLERDELAKSNPIFMRFLPEKNRNSDVTPTAGTVYLICTSAGEVGIDISADHMVCDLTPLDSMAQRLGRVNRYGDHTDTRVDVVHPTTFGKTDKKTGELKADPIDKARDTTLKLLKSTLPLLDGDARDASPKALSHLMDGLTDEQRRAAFSPEPTILPATDILFDAWSLTSIRGKMPGRPPVEPYLHGIADDAPQTTLAWRSELDLLKLDTDDKPALFKSATTLARIFDKHPIRPHETITTAWYHVHDLIKDLINKTCRPDLAKQPLALQFTSGNIEFTTLGKLAEDPGVLRAQPTLIFPAIFDALDPQGLLSIEKLKSKGAENQHDSNAITVNHDVADTANYEREKDLPHRMRLRIQREGDTWAADPLPGQQLPEDWELEARPGASTALVGQIKKKAKGLRITLIQPLSFDDEGDPTLSLICLSPALQANGNQSQQILKDHVSAVEREANRLADELKLPEPYRTALIFAAHWHDEGKKAEVWQRYIGGPDEQGQPLGKSADWRDPKLLFHYRHEFGSLLRIPADQLPADEAVRDLALHLIAAHHGCARPHFDHPFDREKPEAECERIHVETIQRFARLQRKYGRWGLAYLESLLRAADWAASRAAGQESGFDESDDSEGGDE